MKAGFDGRNETSSRAINRRVIVVVALGVLIVCGIVGWRTQKSDTPTVAVAPIQQIAVVPRDTFEALVALQAAHQSTVDDLQMTQDRVGAQQQEIKGLTSEIATLRQELQTLRGSFAKVNTQPDYRPKRRRIKRR